MIVNNTRQDFIEMKVAECHVWDCDQLLRYDGELQFVHPEWFGQAWEHGLPIVAICPSHIIPEGAKIEVLSVKPSSGLTSPESLQDLANRLESTGEEFFIARGNTPTGTWSPVEPQPIFDDAGNRLETFDHANQIDKLDAIAEFQKPRVQEPEEKDCEYYGCSEELRGLVPEPVQHFNEEELKSLEPKEFVFMHEVIGDNDFLHQVWLTDINEGSPHR